MKLIMMIVQDKDVSRLMSALVKKHIGATKISSSGGFLRRGNSVLLVGVEEEQLEETLDIVAHTCKRRKEFVQPISYFGEMDTSSRPLEVEVGGATCFISDCEVRRY
ncbi:MAG: cyclic-di-AMP receptor [Christensenellales bacterium]